jgi:hypothetical protein
MSGFFKAVITHIEQQGLPGGSVDLFSRGEPGTVGALGEYAAVFRLAGSHETGRRFGQVVVVIPSPGERDGADIVRAGTREVLRELAPPEISSEQIERTLGTVTVLFPEHLEISSVLRIIRDAEPNSAIIVGRAELYRAPMSEQPFPGPGLHGDSWALHLYELLTQAAAVLAGTDSYVLLDLGEPLPLRPELRDRLLSLGPSAASSIEPPGLATAQQLADAQRWVAMSAGGQLGVALHELENDESLSEERKVFLRLRLFEAAGMLHRARAELEQHRAVYFELAPRHALLVAMFAEAADYDELSRELLELVLPELRTREDLEHALTLADKLNVPTLLDAARSALAQSFPSSVALKRNTAFQFAGEGRFRDAAELTHGDEEIADYEELWNLIAEYLEHAEDRDPSDFVRAIATQLPERLDEACAWVSQALLNSDREGEAFEILLGELPADGRFTRDRAMAVLAAIQHVALHRGSVDSRLSLAGLSGTLDVLGRSPRDVELRTRLARVLSPEVLGIQSAPLLAYMMLSLNRAPETARELPSGIPAGLQFGDDEGREEAVMETIRRGMQWLLSQPVVAIGGLTLPPEYLVAPAAEVLYVIERLAVEPATHLSGDDDREMLHVYLALAAAVAPYHTDPARDLCILRAVVIQLTHSGRGQHARDLVEEGLALAGDNPHRIRLSWMTYAEVYHRGGNLVEALIGIVSAFAAGSAMTWNEVWEDSLIAFRILRDIGVFDEARQFLERARLALRHAGLEARFGARVETCELQVTLRENERRAGTSAIQIAELLERSTANLREVVELGDELAPAVVTLAEVIRIAKQNNVSVPRDADQLLESLLPNLDPMSKALAESSLQQAPTIEQVVELARRIQPARYEEDTGFDVHRLVIQARRLLAAEAARVPVCAIYAIEALADQTLTLPAADAGSGESTRLLDRVEAPAEAAQEISLHGINVVLAGLGPQGLVRVSTVKGTHGEPRLETEETFSIERLSTWRNRYPHAYGGTDEVNVFFTSTERLGLTELPPRAVIVASTDLQVLPPNLLRVNDDLAGWDRPLASAPSLGWLRAARRHPFGGDGRCLAWIPLTHEGAQDRTLGVLRERLEGTFDEHGISVSTEELPPTNSSGAEMMIVAAHGGIAREGQFFRVVTDDFGRATPPAVISNRLSDVGTVVLFVCSGGRVDMYPGASAVVGFVKRLLSRGVRAVIAPPWPLNVEVPPYWLPTFLDQWSAGAPAIDACFQANLAVRASGRNDPQDCLAMTVYGDPLARRQE